MRRFPWIVIIGLLFMFANTMQVVASTSTGLNVKKADIANGSIVHKSIKNIKITFNQAIKSNVGSADQLNRQIKVYRISNDGSGNEQLMQTSCEISNKNKIEGNLIIKFTNTLNTDGVQYRVVVDKDALRAKDNAGSKLAQDYNLSFSMKDTEPPVCHSISPEPGGKTNYTGISFKFDENVFANIEHRPWNSGNQKIWCCTLNSNGQLTNTYVPLEIYSVGNELFIALINELPNQVADVTSPAKLKTNTTYRLYIVGGTMGDKGYGQGNNINHNFTMDFTYISGLDGAEYMESNAEGLSATNVRKKANDDGTVNVLMDVYNIPAHSITGQGKNGVGALAALTIKKSNNTYYNKIPYLIPGRKISSNFFAGIYDTSVMAYDSWNDPYPFGNNSRDAYIAKKTSLTVKAPADGTIIISKSDYDAYCLNVVDLVFSTFDFTNSVVKLKEKDSYESLVQAIRQEMTKEVVSGQTGYAILKVALQQGDYMQYSSVAINLTARAVQDFITDEDLRKPLLDKMYSSIEAKFGKTVAQKLVSSQVPFIGAAISIGEIAFSAADIAFQTYDLVYWVNNSHSNFDYCTVKIPVSQIPSIP